MKKLLFIVAIFTVINFSADAQQQRKRGQEKLSPEKSAEMRAERMADQLELSEEQKTRIYDIHLERAQSAQQMREAQREEMQARRSAMQEVRKEQVTEVEEVLTPEQKLKWKELRNEDREKMQKFRDAKGNEHSEKLRGVRKHKNSNKGEKIRGNRPNKN